MGRKETPDRTLRFKKMIESSKPKRKRRIKSEEESFDSEKAKEVVKKGLQAGASVADLVFDVIGLFL
jgi:hypothetical protein